MSNEASELKKEKTSSDVLRLRMTTEEDFETIRDVEKKAFGSPYAKAVLEQVLNEAKGQVVLAEVNNQTIGYVMLLFELLDQDRIAGEVLTTVHTSPERRSGIMQDHPGFYGDVEWHSVAIVPEYQKSGWGGQIVAKTRDILLRERGLQRWVAQARVNNIGSLKLLIRELNMSAAGIQAPPTIEEVPMGWGILGSQETNYCLSNEVPPLATLDDLGEEKIGQLDIWIEGMPDPREQFLLPMVQGEQNALEVEDPSEEIASVQMLRRIMTSGRNYPKQGDWAMVGIFTGEELGIVRKNFDPKMTYCFFTREWGLARIPKGKGWEQKPDELSQWTEELRTKYTKSLKK